MKMPVARLTNTTMSKTPLVSTAVAALVLVLSFVLNPSPEKHRAAIKEVIAERSPIAGMLGIGALTAFVSTYHSVGVASYTTVNHRLVSVGVLGMVFVMPPASDP
jgi:hypothetical protein